MQIGFNPTNFFEFVKCCFECLDQRLIHKLENIQLIFWR